MEMTFENPLDPTIVPEEEIGWRRWYEQTEAAKQILDEITVQGSGTLAQRILPEKIIWYGHKLGAILAKDKKLKYAQLRRFVDALKDIEAIEDWGTKIRKLTLFQVQLVHGYSRKKELEPFFTVIKGVIAKDGLIKGPEDFERFMALVDSITAYFEIFEEKKSSE